MKQEREERQMQFKHSSVAIISCEPSGLIIIVEHIVGIHFQTSMSSQQKNAVSRLSSTQRSKSKAAEFSDRPLRQFNAEVCST
jgi:hypothetical protein